MAISQDNPTSKFRDTRVGVLAIQGSFREHLTALRKCGVEAVEVRKPEDLTNVSGLIIPGGESTTMANVAQRNGLISALKEFQESKKPIWGTCAGLIFLAERAIGQKEGGQALLGGLDCTVHRNFFGSQANSFVADIPSPQEILRNGSEKTFGAVFIRAPAIVQTGPGVRVLASYTFPRGLYSDKKNAKSSLNDYDSVIIAVKQDNLLATAFHPELTPDLRWHLLFLQMIQDVKSLDPKPIFDPSKYTTQTQNQRKVEIARAINDPGDLPIFAS